MFANCSFILFIATSIFIKLELSNLFRSGQNRAVTGPSWNFGNIYHLTTRQVEANEGEQGKDEKEQAEGRELCLMELCSKYCTRAA